MGFILLHVRETAKPLASIMLIMVSLSNLVPETGNKQKRFFSYFQRVTKELSAKDASISLGDSIYRKFKNRAKLIKRQCFGNYNYQTRNADFLESTVWIHS